MLLALAAIALLLGDNLTSEGRVTNDPESLRAYGIIDRAFPDGRDFTTELVILRSGEHTIDDEPFRAKVQAVTRAARATGVVASARTYLESDDPTLVSRDRHATLVPIRLRPPEDENADGLVEAVRAADGGGFEVAVTGTHTTNRDFNEVSQHDLEAGELRFGLPAALIVLVLVFGAVVAASLPVVLALVSILVALGLTAVVASTFELSVFVVNMLTGMGLALGIDYALFVVSRFREERRQGRDKLDAIGTTGATASRAVLFSGTAFVLAMLGLLLVQSTIMRSLATGAILVGIVSIVAALTLLPAVLSLLGDRVNAVRVPFVGRTAGEESRLWAAIVRGVVRRPVVSLAAATVLLLAAAAPALTMEIGAAGISTLPDRLESKQGFLALERSFPASGAQPAELVVTPASRADDAIAALRSRLERDPSFGPVSVRKSEREDVALVTVPVAADALSDEAVDAVKRLRADYVPGAFAGTGARTLVTGLTAENIDYFAVMEKWLPIVLAFVLGLSFVLLTVSFRSLVVSATAIVLNLLSVGATYGLVVAVFQHGVGADLLGFQQVETIEAWVPLFLFAVLFGLSMDYQVFLLSRIRERHALVGDTEDAVVFGISSTARIITGAALIIVAVFSGFAAGDLVMFQQMGFGIAVALLIDATIVRSVLVPAAMHLLAERNWYLPSWLQWLPHLEVEGREPPSPEPSPPPAGA